MLGQGVQFDLAIDGKDAGALAANTFLRIDVLSGEYVITSSSENSEQTVVKAETGRSYFFNVAGDMGVLRARVQLEQVTEEQGRHDVAASRLETSFT